MQGPVDGYYGIVLYRPVFAFKLIQGEFRFDALDYNTHLEMEAIDNRARALFGVACSRQ